MICAGSLFAAAACFFVYLIAYERGRARGRIEIVEERYDESMENYWDRQDWRRENGLSYLTRDLDHVEAANGRDR